MMKIAISFVLGLLFVMHASAADLTAHAYAAHQGKEGLLMTGGRKMAMAAQRNYGELTDATATIASSSSFAKNSGATICDYSDEARKEDLNVVVSCHHHKSGSSTSSAKKKLKVARHHYDHFVAFGADYHGPVRHPPKHN